MWLIKYIYCLLHRHAITSVVIENREIYYCLRCGHVENSPPQKALISANG